MAKFIFKANDFVLSYCKCENEPAMSSGQLDCPWCGCGYLISCSKCAKAFTYATVRETHIPLAELARREAITRGISVRIDDEAIDDWVQSMSDALASFSINEKVIYLDGRYFPVDQLDINFTGYFATHSLDRLPHFEAMKKPDRLRDILGSKTYWFNRQRPERNEDG